MKKNILIILIVLFTLISFLGCQKSKENNNLVNEQISDNLDNSVNKKLKIALVMKTLTNPFFIEMEKGARKAEKDNGIELIVRTGAKETSIDQQIQIVEQMIKEKVDAIVIAPGSSTDLVKVLKKAQDAKIVIVNIDNQLDPLTCKNEGLVNVPFISVQNDEGAYLSVKEICDFKDSSQKQAVIIEGIRDAENAKLRKAGAEKAFKEFPFVKIVASETANWKIDEAYKLSGVLLKKFPKATLIFCANDMMALGVVQYCKENRRSDIKIAGFDNLDDAKIAIKDGWMQSTVDQQAALQGYTGVEAAIKLINKEKVKMTEYIPVKIINRKALLK